MPQLYRYISQEANTMYEMNLDVFPIATRKRLHMVQSFHDHLHWYGSPWSQAICPNRALFIRRNVHSPKVLQGYRRITG